jgi:beta-mannosidase
MLCCELKKDGTSITKNNFFFFKPKDLKLTKPIFDYQHEIIDSRHFITIYSYNFIYKLYINCLNCKGIFSNNYFEMLPNEKITIEFEPIEKLEKNSNSLSFDFKSLYDLMN